MIRIILITLFLFCLIGSPEAAKKNPPYWFLVKIAHTPGVTDDTTYRVTIDFLKLLCEDRKGVFETEERIEFYRTRPIDIAHIGCLVTKKIRS